MKSYITKKGLWTLFLMSALPIHIWTFYLSFADFSWIAAWSTIWDAIGVLSYALLFALVESILVFMVAAVAVLLISNKWEETRRIAVLSVLIFVLSSWAMFGQANFLWNLSVPRFLHHISVLSSHPVRLLYTITGIFVLFSVLIPVFLVMRSERAYLLIKGLIDKLAFLTVCYLFIDGFALVIILIRNL